MYLVLELLASAGDGGVKDTVNDVSAGQERIFLALIGIVTMSVAALVFVIRNSKVAADVGRQITEVNKAVNNIGPGEHRLYDKIDNIEKSVNRLEQEQTEFDSHGWDKLPPDLANAVALTTTIRDLQNHHHSVESKLENIDKKLDITISELRDHVRWEIEEKYHSRGHHDQ